MSDVLLVNSPVKDAEADQHNRMCPPLGLGYIAAVLIQNDYKVDALDLNIPNIDINLTDPYFLRTIDTKIHEAYLNSFNSLRNVIMQEKPSIVGISAHTGTFSNALKIAEMAKEVNPDVVVVIGGPHVTFRPEDALSSKSVDFVVRGEGEFTMLELTNHLLRGRGDIKEIKGISFKHEETGIKSNPARPLIQNLDVLPYPARQLFRLKLYPYSGSVSSARGCPYQCIFCAARAMSGGRYRIRTAENILGELTSLYNDFGIRYFNFIDDTFAVSAERAVKICDLIKESHMDVSWACSTRVNTVNEKLLELMAKSGCNNILFGAESGVQSILNKLCKGTTVEQIRKVVKWCISFGISPTLSFMAPHPWDTLETVEETAKFMRELLDLGVNSGVPTKWGVTVTLAVTTPFPGTYLYENAEKLGLTFTSRNWEDYDCGTPVFYTKNLPKEDVSKAIKNVENLLNKSSAVTSSKTRFRLQT
ncbi:MAG TPA: radical SAM protein, partial [archaeon]|nr:radical SAM protein [archaeon]